MCRFILLLYKENPPIKTFLINSDATYYIIHITDHFIDLKLTIKTFIQANDTKLLAAGVSIIIIKIVSPGRKPLLFKVKDIYYVPGVPGFEELFVNLLSKQAF